MMTLPPEYTGMKYNMDYDAFYDPETLEWVEEKCGDPDCDFCHDRPEKAPEDR